MLTSHAIAESDVLDAKNGFLFGIGGGGSRFTYPDTYSGTKMNAFDDKATLFGGMAQLGYDTLLFRRIVLGLRAEGFIMDTLSTGNTDTNRLNGKASATHALVRLGIVFRVNTFDPVGDPSKMSLEVFAEAGPTKGQRKFSKRYIPGGGDQYNGDVEEDYKGQAIAGGLNLTNNNGAFFEIKALHTTISDSDMTFEGTKTENGSTTNLAQTEGNKKNFTSFFFILGHHF